MTNSSSQFCEVFVTKKQDVAGKKLQQNIFEQAGIKTDNVYIYHNYLGNLPVEEWKKAI